jgi:hypothetical protein
MADATQEPGLLNISFVRGDDWSQLVDFSTPTTLTGYTFTSGLYSTVSGELVQSITCTVTSEALAQVTLSLTATQTAALASGTYQFRVTWGTTARRIYQGFCEVLP